ANRISVITRQLVDIARKHARAAGKANIAEVASAVKIEGVKVNVTGGPSSAVAADAGQLQEIIEVFGRAGRERTKVSLSWQLSGEIAKMTLEGDGMAPESKTPGAVFDPVLTKTEPPAGLTLFQAYRIVREWGGDLTYEATPSGPRFTISL